MPCITSLTSTSTRPSEPHPPGLRGESASWACAVSGPRARAYIHLGKPSGSRSGIWNLYPWTQDLTTKTWRWLTAQNLTTAQQNAHVISSSEVQPDNVQQVWNLPTLSSLWSELSSLSSSMTAVSWSPKFILSCALGYGTRGIIARRKPEMCFFRHWDGAIVILTQSQNCPLLVARRLPLHRGFPRGWQLGWSEASGD